VPNPKQDGQGFYVSNPDSILSGEDVAFINQCAADLEQQTEVELCVVVLQSIGDADMFDFCYELFQTWGIGHKGKNTGVLVCFAMDSHDIRIMPGTGIEGVLTDFTCGQILDEEMVPAFRQGKFGEGICCGVLRIYEICTEGEAPEELRNMQSVTNRGKYASASEDDGEGWEVWILLSMVLFCLFLGIRAKILSKPICPKCKKRKVELVKDEVQQVRSYSKDGKGIFHYKCKKCGHEWQKPYTLPRYTRSSSSGYSSGSSSGSWSSSSRSSSSHSSWGGGSTSGGGAGRKW
jgi:uncharacterized protein